ncbi:MAG: hypothetical protein U5J95_03910 [Balneolaceae bacterium]|nr:hypothetical protein [Balneolaceae bacterium]
MTEEERQKLIELRKKQLKERELQNDLFKDLDLEEKKKEMSEIRGKYDNYIEYAMIFVVTLVLLYTFFFLVSYIFMGIAGVALRQMEVSLAWVVPLIHVFVWTMTLWSVWRKKSVLDDVTDFLS